MAMAAGASRKSEAGWGKEMPGTPWGARKNGKMMEAWRPLIVNSR
jgi:hypothetical protein